MGEPKDRSSAPLGRVVLAHEPSFTLGNLGVTPPTRQVAAADRSEILEPRVMQVLVALSRAGGTFVTRDELIERCWDGRIVTDDAISRPISQIRQIAADIGEGSFEVETVTKVGYRLIAQRSDVARVTTDPINVRHLAAIGSAEIRPRMIATAGLALMVIAAVTGYFVFGGTKPETTRILIVGSEAGGPAPGYASSIALEMAPVLAARAEDATIIDSATDRGEQADYQLRVAIAQSGTSSEGSLALTSRHESGIVWSRNWTASDLTALNLKLQMSFVASTAMLCALEGNKGGLRNRNGALGFYVEACVRNYDSDYSEGELINLLTKTIERAPDFAPASALLAVIYSQRIGQLRVDRQAIPVELFKKSQIALENARKTDPNSARTILAEGLAQGMSTRSLPFMDRAVEADPFDPLIRYYRAPALMEVGRMDDAIVDARKSVELNPPSAAIRAGLVRTLMDSGRSKEAGDELSKAESLWPSSSDIRRAKFLYEFVHGDPRIARTVLKSNLGLDDRQIEAFDHVISAKIDPRPANVDLVLAKLWRAREKEPRLGILYFYVLSLSNRFDEIFGLLAEPGFRSRLTPFALFAPENGPIRADPRVMKIAAEYGLISYWRSSGKWPDFCADRGLPYDCKLEAAKYR